MALSGTPKTIFVLPLFVGRHNIFYFVFVTVAS